MTLFLLPGRYPHYHVVAQHLLCCKSDEEAGKRKKKDACAHRTYYDSLRRYCMLHVLGELPGRGLVGHKLQRACMACKPASDRASDGPMMVALLVWLSAVVLARPQVVDHDPPCRALDGYGWS